MEKVKFTAWMIVAILIMRWIIIALFTVLNNESNVIGLLPDTIAIFTVIILLLFGIRVKQPIRSEWVMQKSHYLDKLVDELAKGKTIDNILRITKK